MAEYPCHRATTETYHDITSTFAPWLPIAPTAPAPAPKSILFVSVFQCRVRNYKRSMTRLLARTRTRGVGCQKLGVEFRLEIVGSGEGSFSRTCVITWLWP